MGRGKEGSDQENLESNWPKVVPSETVGSQKSKKKSYWYGFGVELFPTYIRLSEGNASMDQKAPLQITK